MRYVLHGSVRRSDKALRIAVELTEAQSGQVIWADRFDGDLTDLFDLQDRIAIRVATAVAPHLRERELSRALRKHPASMTAYDLTLQALDLFYRMDRASITRARELLEQAVAHDPDYAPAYSHMASLHMRWIGQGGPRRDGGPRDGGGRSPAGHRSGSQRCDGLAIYGHVQSYLLKDYSNAIDYFNRALPLVRAVPGLGAIAVSPADIWVTMKLRSSAPKAGCASPRSGPTRSGSSIISRKRTISAAVMKRLSGGAVCRRLTRDQIPLISAV